MSLVDDARFKSFALRNKGRIDASAKIYVELFNELGKLYNSERQQRALLSLFILTFVKAANMPKADAIALFGELKEKIK